MFYRVYRCTIMFYRVYRCTIMFYSVYNNNNNNICLKSNIQTSSVDYAPRELTHACCNDTCSRSDTDVL